MKKFATLAMAAFTLAAAAPAVAQAPTMTLSISRVGGGPTGTTTVATHGQLVRVSGNLSSGAANQAVTLVVSPYRGEARTLTLRTDTEGEFRYTHRPFIRTTYAARTAGMTSAQDVVAHVRPKVGLRVVSAQRGQFRVTMAAIPQHVSRVVQFQRRITASRWATVKRVQLRGRNLSALFTARLPAGMQQVRISVPQTPGYLRATSRFVRVSGTGS
jgi:hypothetical protein